MKKILFYFLGFVGIMFMQSGCSDGAIGDDFAEEQYAPEGTLITSGSSDGCFLTDPSISTVSFDVDSQGETPTSADVLVSYNGGGDVVFTTVSAFPSTVSIAMTDLLGLVGVNTADVAAGDLISIGFDGKTSAGSFRSGQPKNFNVGCVSELAGDHPFVSTNLAAVTNSCPTDPVEGVVTFGDLGCGVYSVSDLGFGQYGTSCWNDSPATSGNAIMTDVCNQIISGGQDQYGLTYDWVITDVQGPELFISWANDYGDSGDVVITKGDGGDWPALFTK